MPKRLLQILLLFTVAFTMLGADDASTTHLDKIGHKLVCQCGCGQILMECNHVGCPVSGPMIEELKAQLASGSSEAAILQTFITKYGPVVLAAPIRGGFDNAAWIVPVVVFLLAIVGTAFLIHRWRSRHALAMAGAPVMPGATLPYGDCMRDRIRRET